MKNSIRDRTLRMRQYLRLRRALGAWCSTGLLSALVIPNAHSFTVARFDFLGTKWFSDNNHERITREGLAGPLAPIVIKRSGKTITFSGPARDQIAEANRLTDSEHYSDPVYHFDSERGDESSKAILVWKDEIVNQVKLKNYSSARNTFGTALHVIQDFYAHSNWVEEQGARENTSLGVSIFSTSVPGGWAPNPRTCDDKSYIKGSFLTTGFYSYDQTFSGSRTYWTNTYGVEADAFSAFPPDRCVHGGSEKSNLPPNVSDVGAGINKDSKVRVGFDDASAAATKSTTSFANLVIQMLRNGVSDDAGDDAVCGFLGQELHQFCQAKYAGKVQFDGSISMNPAGRYYCPVTPGVFGSVIINGDATFSGTTLAFNGTFHSMPSACFAAQSWGFGPTIQLTRTAEGRYTGTYAFTDPDSPNCPSPTTCGYTMSVDLTVTGFGSASRVIGQFTYEQVRVYAPNTFRAGSVLKWTAAGPIQLLPASP